MHEHQHGEADHYALCKPHLGEGICGPALRCSQPVLLDHQGERDPDPSPTLLVLVLLVLAA